MHDRCGHAFHYLRTLPRGMWVDGLGKRIRPLQLAALDYYYLYLPCIIGARQNNTRHLVYDYAMQLWTGRGALVYLAWGCNWVLRGI